MTATREAAQWATGECFRGHDITDPANVKTLRRAGGWVDRNCRECVRLNERERKAGREPRVPQPKPAKPCQQCGATMVSTCGNGEQWARRRYCCRACAWLARRGVPLERSRRLDDGELARLRRMVGAA